MNSNPQKQPRQVDRSSDAQGDSQSVAVEMERLHELQRQVTTQEQRLRSLRQQVADSSDGSRVPSSAEQDVMKSLILTKESELATALVKVAELTSQLERLRRTCADESRSSQKTTETRSQPKGVVQRIIPIRIVKEDILICRESKRVSRHDSDTRPTAEENETIRVIPIVLEKPAQISKPVTAIAGQQHHGSTVPENSVIGQQYPVQTDRKPVADDKGIGRNGKAMEMKERTKYFDANENVKANDKKFTILPADTKNSYAGNGIADNGVKPCGSVAEKDAVERVGETKYSCEVAEKVNVDVAGFDGEKNEETKLEDASDTRKIFDVVDKSVDNKTVNVRDDVSSKLQNVRGGVVVKDRKSAVGRSHSVSDRTENARQSLDEQKKDFFGKTSRNINANNSADDRNEENKMKAFSQDKKSLSDFSLSNQLLALSKGPVDAAEQCTKSTVTCTNGTSKSAQCQPPSGPGPNRATETGFKTDRARFFMDMVKEDAVETGVPVVQPWKEVPKNPAVSGEFRKSVSPAVSPSTSVSRGRSSSSAIMSRFAPQPYGRSKSMDSGGLRVPMATLSVAVQLPTVMASVADTVSSDITNTGDTVSVSSYRVSDQHSVASPSDRLSRKLDSPAAIPESHAQVETSVTSSRTVPYSLPFKNSTASSGSLCQPKSALAHKSLAEEKADVTSISSLSGTLNSDSKTSKTELCQPRTTSTSVLSGDKAGYSMPASIRPMPVTSSSTSADKLPSTTEPLSSVSPAMTGAAEKTLSSAVDSKPPLTDHTMSPIISVSCGMAKSLNTKPSLASRDEQTVTLLQNAKSPYVCTSSQNATVQLKVNALPEHCSPAVSVNQTSSHTTSSLTKPSSIPAAAAAKGSNECKSTEVKIEEEISNTAWDSNVKRLAHIYAVTIGGTVQGRTNVPRDRNRDGNIKVPLFSNESINSSISRAPNCSRDKKNSEELDCVKSLPGPTSSKTPGQDTLVSPGSSGATSPTVRHKENTDSCDIVEQSSEAVSATNQLKIDTSADSVSSALSVLLKSNSSAHSSPVRPSRLRSNISSAYRRKLGNGTMDNYSQNMTLLYGDRLASKDGSISSDVQEPSDEIKEIPLIEDLPHILALDTLDGMPICPRIGSHLKDAQDFNVTGVCSRTTDGWRSESFKSGDVGVTVISSPKQMADLVHLDSEDGRRNSADSFNPSDDAVSSYIDDPATLDEGRVASEMASQSSVHLFDGRGGKFRRRVTFDHVSLLLNAALEGEKDLVVDVLSKSANPNHKTETGLSALHNAVCGNHIDILKYLVEFGCDVNVEDNDGWTPMHCAASTNNVEMLRILVENGASVLPMTISDRETPVQKCSRNLPAYKEAVRYLTDAANILGIANDRWVYVTSNFTNVCSDELILCAGERLKILRRGDESESEWWWAKSGEAEGYAPQSLLALYPRVQPKWSK